MKTITLLLIIANQLLLEKYYYYIHLMLKDFSFLH